VTPMVRGREFPELHDALSRAEHARDVAGQQVAASLHSSRRRTALNILRVFHDIDEDLSSMSISEKIGYAASRGPHGFGVSGTVGQNLRWLSACFLLHRRGGRPCRYRGTDLGMVIVKQSLPLVDESQIPKIEGEISITDTITRYHMELSTIGWRIHEILRKAHQSGSLRVLKYLMGDDTWHTVHQISLILGRDTVDNNTYLYRQLDCLKKYKLLHVLTSPKRYRLTDLGVSVARHAIQTQENRDTLVVHGPSRKTYAIEVAS
jgi:hypothetical protein